MAPQYSFFFLFTLLTFSLSFQEISAAPKVVEKFPKYVIVNDAPTHGGGIKFEKILGGVAATKKLVLEINKFIWNLWKQHTPADRKQIDTVTIFIKDCPCGEAVTWGGNYEFVNVNAIYIRDYAGPMDLKWEFKSLLYHELSHVLQFFGNGMTPIPLMEGIADYTILKAKYFPPAFAKPGTGDKWDKGYDYTARFLEYCDGLVPDFTPKLNKMMRTTYDVSYFKNLTGKPVEQLWKEYKAKYGNKP